MNFGPGLALLVAAPLLAQARVFEVVSIKPWEATAKGTGMSLDGWAGLGKVRSVRYSGSCWLES